MRFLKHLFDTWNKKAINYKSLFIFFLIPLFNLSGESLRLENFGFTEDIKCKNINTTVVILPNINANINETPFINFLFKKQTTYPLISIFLNKTKIYEGLASHSIRIPVHPSAVNNVFEHATIIKITNPNETKLTLSNKSEISIWDTTDFWVQKTKNSLLDYYYLGAASALKLYPPSGFELNRSGTKFIKKIISFLNHNHEYKDINLHFSAGHHQCILPFTQSEYTTNGFAITPKINTPYSVHNKLFINQVKVAQTISNRKTTAPLHTKGHIFTLLNQLSLQHSSDKPFILSSILINHNHPSKIAYSIENYLSSLKERNIYIYAHKNEKKLPIKISYWLGTMLSSIDNVSLIPANYLKKNEWLMTYDKLNKEVLEHKISSWKIKRKKNFKILDQFSYDYISLIHYPSFVGILGLLNPKNILPNALPSNFSINELVNKNSTWHDLVVLNETIQRKKFIKNQRFFWKNSRFYVIVTLTTIATSILLFFKKNLNQGQP